MALADIFKAYEERLKGVDKDFGGLNAETIQKALSSGGALSSSLGFDSPGDVLGLTPEQFDKSLANRSQILSDNLKAVSGAVSLRDALYGVSEKRQALRQAARDSFLMEKESELQGERIAAEDQRDLRHMAEQERQFDAQMGFEEKKFDYQKESDKASLDFQKEKHKDDMAFNLKQLNVQSQHYKALESNNSFSNSLALKQLGLKERELEMLGEYRKEQLTLATQRYTQKELQNTDTYIANLLAKKDKKGKLNYETQGALFFATIKRNAMAGVSGPESLIEVPTEKHLFSENKKLMGNYTHVIIAPADGPSWKKGDVLGVQGDKVDTKPLMPNPAANKTSMGILLNKMPGYRMAVGETGEE